MPFPVACSLICLFHPVPALRQKIFVFDLSSQRNKEVRLFLSAHTVIDSVRGSAFTRKPTPVHSLKAWSRPPPAFHLALVTQDANKEPWPSRLKGSIRSEPKSSCFRVYRFENLLSWISPSHRQQSALIPWCQRASSCLLSCPKTVYHWRKTLPRQGSPVQLLSLSRLPRLASFGAPGVRPLGLDFLVEDAVQRSSPIRLVNPLFALFPSLFLLSLYLTGAENTTLLITKRIKSNNSVSNGLSLEATCLLSIDRREQTAIGCFAYLFYYVWPAWRHQRKTIISIRVRSTLHSFVEQRG